jgi:rubredoxin
MKPYGFFIGAGNIMPVPKMRDQPMPWKCPACQTIIEHDTSVQLHRPGTIYRCHVCRLELVIDPATDRLVLAPMPEQT